MLKHPNIVAYKMKKEVLMKQRLQSILVWGVMFLVMYIFYTRIHPLVIYDIDDWTYISNTRDALPLIGNWNPSRILPEILMPLSASLSAYLIYPFVGDYIMSMAYVFAFILCSTILTYIYLFNSILINKVKLDKKKSLLITIIFLMMHFWIFRSAPQDNIYAFYSTNVTCYFYYIIPSLYNIILIFLLELYPNVFNINFSEEPLKTGTILLALYLAIFSNLFSSYILAIWVGVKSLISFVSNIHNKNTVIGFLKNNRLNIIIIGLWLISMIYELSGGRAHSLENTSYADMLKTTVLLFSNFYKKINPLFLKMCAAESILLLFFIIRQKICFSEKFKFVMQIVLFGFASLLYIIMLCAKTMPGYIEHAEVIIGLTSIVIFCSCIILAELTIICNTISVAFPIMCCIIFFNINVPKQTFFESNSSHIDWTIAYQVDNYIIKQIKENEDQNEIELHVPFHASEDNWPHSLFAADRFSQSLYKHGIISKKVKINMIPDRNVNLKYGIDVQ